MNSIYLIKPRNKYNAPTNDAESNTLVSNLLRKTSFISEQLFDQALQDVWSNFKQHITNVEFIVLYDEAYRLEAWCLSLLKEEVKTITSDQVCEVADIVLVLDSVLSYHVVYETIQNFLFRRFGKKLPAIKYNFHIVAPFMCSDAIRKAIRLVRSNVYSRNLFGNLHLYAKYRVDPTLWSQEENDQLMQLGATDINMIAVIFDFMIPDRYTSYHDIYSSLCK